MIEFPLQARNESQRALVLPCEWRRAIGAVRLAAVLSAATLIVVAAGCRKSGLERYEVSGAVTLDGKPVPGGEVTFEVDRTKGNQGPRTIARIKDGRYETPRDKGVLGGAYLVFVFPTDGQPKGETLPLGKPLIRKTYQLEMELPHEDAERDIDVPSEMQ